MFGRNGESPVPIVAPQTPADCFRAAMDAVRIATTYRTPVFLLSDGYLANGSEPWLIPRVESLPDLRVPFATATNHVLDEAAGTADFWPYLRDPETLARPWAIPGTAGLEHRIGGIEKKDGSGVISYDPANHDFMVRTRAAKIAGIEVPPLEVEDPTGDADVLVLGWGSSFGPITGAVRNLRGEGVKVAQAHLRYLNPMPANTEEVLRSYRRVVVPEMNLGQLALLIRGLYLVDAIGVNQVRGLPFRVAELMTALRSVIDGTEQRTVIGTAGRYGTSVTTTPNGVPSIEVGGDAADDPAAQPFETDHEVELLSAEAPPGDSTDEQQQAATRSADAGTYTVRITNASGTTTSRKATLTVK